MRSDAKIVAVLRHVVLFQLSVILLLAEEKDPSHFRSCFFTILVLAGLSTWIDLAHGRGPSQFGTQDVALLLTAYGPLIVFGTNNLSHQCIRN